MTYLIESMKKEGYRIIVRYNDSIYMGNGKEVILFYLDDGKWKYMVM